jgi:hypothetical protein
LRSAPAATTNAATTPRKYRTRAVRSFDMEPLLIE